jgi:hypothetical protein
MHAATISAALPTDMLPAPLGSGTVVVVVPASVVVVLPVVVATAVSFPAQYPLSHKPHLASTCRARQKYSK